MRNILTALLVLFPISSFAIVNEIAFDFGYDRTIYGKNRQNSNINRTYSGGLSTYIFDYTAIDLNASVSSDITTESERYNVTTNIDLVGQQNRVKTTVYGVGLKQTFAPRNARLIPGISLGYARQFVNYQSDLTIENTTTKAQATVSGGETKQRIDSVFGTASLQLRLTERMSFKASVKTLIPAFKLDKVRDNVKYAFGFSWIF